MARISCCGKIVPLSVFSSSMTSVGALSYMAIMHPCLEENAPGLQVTVVADHDVIFDILDSEVVS